MSYVDDIKDKAQCEQIKFATLLRNIRPKEKYVDENLKERRLYPFTYEYNNWRYLLVSMAHLLKDVYGIYFDWDKFIDDAKFEE